MECRKKRTDGEHNGCECSSLLYGVAIRDVHRGVAFIARKREAKAVRRPEAMTGIQNEERDPIKI